MKRNQDLEFERNKERFVFLKWGASALKNLLIVPPGSGIVHQVLFPCTKHRASDIVPLYRASCIRYCGPEPSIVHQVLCPCTEHHASGIVFRTERLFRSRLWLRGSDATVSTHKLKYSYSRY